MRILKLILLICLSFPLFGEEPSVFDDEDSYTVEFPIPKSLQKKVSPKKPLAKTEEEILGKKIDKSSKNEDLKPFVKTNPKPLRAQSLFLSFERLPKRVYVKEIFPVIVKSIAVFKNLQSLSYSLIGGKDFNLLNKEALFEKIDENEYKITLYFQLLSLKGKLPLIKVTAKDKSGYIESSTLSFKPIKVFSLRHDKYFCNVLADSLIVEKYKTTRFDENSYMFVMKIAAKRANIDDFHLDWVLRDKIESKKGDFLESNFIYIAFIPSSTKEFNFKYFNLQNRRFENFSFPVILEKEELSTQLDLNPKASNFDIYKNIFLATVALIFLTLFAFKIKKNRWAVIYLFIALAIGAYVIKDELPFSDITLKKGAKVTILPTRNSTIFYTAPKSMRVKVLNRVDPYYKILLPNNKIGWVKNEDIK